MDEDEELYTRLIEEAVVREKHEAMTAKCNAKSGRASSTRAPTAERANGPAAKSFDDMARDLEKGDSTVESVATDDRETPKTTEDMMQTMEEVPFDEGTDASELFNDDVSGVSEDTTDSRNTSAPMLNDFSDILDYITESDQSAARTSEGLGDLNINDFLLHLDQISQRGNTSAERSDDYLSPVQLNETDEPVLQNGFGARRWGKWI